MEKNIIGFGTHLAAGDGAKGRAASPGRSWEGEEVLFFLFDVYTYVASLSVAFCDLALDNYYDDLMWFTSLIQ